MSNAKCPTVVVCVFLGCTGRLDSGGGDVAGSGGPGQPSASAAAGRPGGGAGAAPGAPGVPDASGRAACAGTLQPGPAYLRRLTNDEYARAVAEALLLGADPVATAATLAPTLNLVNEGFGDIAASLNVTSSHMDRYLTAAQRLAAMAVASPERRMAIAGCDAVGADPCLTTLIKTVGRRAFRRTLTDAEAKRLRALADAARADTDPTAPARVALAGLLVSPRFLYRVETGGAPDRRGWRALSGPEVATRLAFFLWGGPPDQAVLDAAEGGALGTADGVRAQAARMLDDARAHGGMLRPVTSWLQLYELDQIARPATQYPAWSEGLRASMKEETRRTLEDFVWARDGSVFDALTAGYSYVDANLGKLYGLPAAGAGWRKVPFAASDPRGGLLTQAGMLALPVSGTEVTAAILRGKYVRDSLLCTPPAPPPPNIPPVPAGATLSPRQRLAQHRANPACTPCHQLLDPIGLAFERYDGIGAYRAEGSNGEALTGEGQLFGLPGDPVVHGPKELSALLGQSRDVHACAVTHLFEFAYGRVPLVNDACARAETLTAFEAGGLNMRTLLVALVSSDAFRYVGDGK